MPLLVAQHRLHSLHQYKNHLVTVPGFSINLISKHLPKSLANSLGHQDQEQKNLRSTKSVSFADSTDTPATSTAFSSTKEDTPENDMTPSLLPKSHEICCMVISQNEISKSYSDQTGKFPVPSSGENHYIFILYHRDTNSIHATPIPNQQTAILHNAWESTHKILVKQGNPLDLHILDNECSQDLKDAFLKYDINFQRVSP